jgi:ubiquinone/menaquinone biosynthesis C-methylase UbiE
LDAPLGQEKARRETPDKTEPDNKVEKKIRTKQEQENLEYLQETCLEGIEGHFIVYAKYLTMDVGNNERLKAKRMLELHRWESAVRTRIKQVLDADPDTEPAKRAKAILAQFEKLKTGDPKEIEKFKESEKQRLEEERRAKEIQAAELKRVDELYDRFEGILDSPIKKKVETVDERLAFMRTGEELFRYAVDDVEKIATGPRSTLIERLLFQKLRPLRMNYEKEVKNKLEEADKPLSDEEKKKRAEQKKKLIEEEQAIFLEGSKIVFRGYERLFGQPARKRKIGAADLLADHERTIRRALEYVIQQDGDSKAAKEAKELLKKLDKI